MAIANFIENYKGYDIMKHYGSYKGYTGYYFICKDGESITTMALSSVKACKNVIATHERFMEENKMPITIQ